MSFDTLGEKIRRLGNPTVVGLDPKLEKIPSFIRGEAFAEYGNTLEAAEAAILRFNKAIIDAVCDIVPAVKPQCAYYELYGWQGVRALSKTIGYARQKGLYVITDGKRNDIGPTMEAYANAHLGRIDVNGGSLEPFGADALTVNGYLGTDGIRPLLKVCKQYGKCVFVLAKTSNPSSGELQDQLVGGKPLYVRMGELCEKWSRECAPGEDGYGCVGAVVGATYPSELAELRRMFAHTFFLVPGYGAQGGGAADAAPAFDENGGGAIVNSSRAILYAYQKENCGERDFAAAARREAVRMRGDLAAVLAKSRR